MSQSPSLRGSGRFKHGAARDLNSDNPSVSIPFIAGQWSLPIDEVRMTLLALGVSIPFIAGQWSLLGELISWMDAFVKSQSPSLRGSGRFSSPSAGEE